MALARAVEAGDGRDAAALDEMALSVLDRLARARSDEVDHVANLAQVRQLIGGQLPGIESGVR